MDEAEAIERLRRGDIAGLELLVRRYQTTALRAAQLVTRDRALAEDVVQAAFIRRITTTRITGRTIGPRSTPMATATSVPSVRTKRAVQVACCGRATCMIS